MGLDPVLLWLWCRPAAVALIQSLAWECPYATDAALKKKKKKGNRRIDTKNLIVTKREKEGMDKLGVWG